MTSRYTLEYKELLVANNKSDLKIMSPLNLLKSLCGSKYYQNVLTIFARIFVPNHTVQMWID